MKTNSQLNRKVRLAFGSAILALLVVGAISYRGMAMSSESDRWVRHTHEVLENLQNLLFALGSIESDCRGFVLTGKESYLESFRANKLSVEQVEATVRNLTADNPRQQRQISILATLVGQKVQFGEMVIGLSRNKGLRAAADAIRDEPGQQIMDECQRVLREMQVEELRLLVLRDADAKPRLSRTKTVLMLGTLLGVLTAAAAGWSAQRDNLRRELSEEAFFESEDRFRILVEGVQDYAIFTLDPGGKVVSWNAGAERIKGYKADEIIGQNFSRFYLQTDIDQGKPAQELQIAAVSGRSETEIWRVRKNGSRFWANVVITAARNSSGNLLGFSEISRDISERKETEAKYRGLLEAAPDAMVVVNQCGEIVLLNLQTEKQFGYNRDELVGQKVKNIIPEGFAERLIADGAQSPAGALTQQIGTGIELAGRRKDGSEFPIEIMLSPLESAEGILVTAAIRDISLRKDAEKHLARIARELRVKHRLLDSVVEGTTDPIYIRDLENCFTLANSACAKVLGRSVNEVVGRSLRGLLPNNSVDAIIQSDQEIVLAGATSTMEETAEIDGITRLFLTTKCPYRDDDQKIIGTIGISRDITERKKSEEHLVKTVGELKRSNDELQQFAYVASHDLQEPLRMVASYTQLLAQRYKGRLDSDADEFIAYAVDGANRMQRLIQDLLVYSRAGTNGRSLREISTGNALKEALTNLRATIDESGAIVTHDSLPFITTDGTQLVQVFQNLVGNAIKYRSAEVPRVHVSAAKNGGNEWIFSVRDNGLGIDPQYFERIFILFQRLHGPKEFKGTGIGLSICKKMLERVGGRIWVDSQPERGSTFYFALPERDVK
jgi:PAS domain S-box-containing protein